MVRLPKPSGVPQMPRLSKREVVPPPQQPAQKAAMKKSYGIEDAIRLMKRIPDGDMRVLAAVIKETLESTDIQVVDILKDAEIKEEHLEEGIRKLDAEIEDLEIMINQRKESIHALLTDLEETRQVKHDLAMAASGESEEPRQTEGLRSKAANEYAEKIRDSVKQHNQQESAVSVSLDGVEVEGNHAKKSESS